MMEMLKTFALEWSAYMLIAFVLVDMGVRRVFEKGYSSHEDWLSLLSGVGAKISAIIMPVWMVKIPMNFAWDFGLTTIETTPLSLGILFVLCDLVYYWEHRLSHSIRWFWSAHEVHHTALRVTMATGVRISWLRVPLFLVVFRLPLVWIGFDPLWVTVMSVLVGVFQVVVHNEEFPKVPVLDAFLVMPTHHRTHHFADWRMNRNFGGVFIVWDRIFGTFAPEPDDNDHTRYGLGYWEPTGNIFVMNLRSAVTMFIDAARSLSSGDVAGAWWSLFGSPGKRRETSVRVSSDASS